MCEFCATRKLRESREDKIKQNITLSIEKDIIKKARLISAQNGTSISKMLSDKLKQIIDKEEQHETAKRSALHTLKKGFRLGGKDNMEAGRSLCFDLLIRSQREEYCRGTSLGRRL